MAQQTTFLPSIATRPPPKKKSARKLCRPPLSGFNSKGEINTGQKGFAWWPVH